MKASIPPFMIAATGLSAAGTGLAQALPPQLPQISMMHSTVPYQCSPGTTASVDLQPASIAFHLSSLTFETEGHGRTEEYAECFLDVNLVGWFYKWRVYIRDVTYSGRANLTDGVQITQLTAHADFKYIHRDTYDQPLIQNLSSSVMLDNVQSTAIGGDGDFLDNFEVKSDTTPASDLVWSPCFNGEDEEGQDTTQLSLQITGTTQDPDDAGAGTGQFAEGGMTVTLGLAWEECVPERYETYAWGDSRTDDWETCTYKDTTGNGSTTSTVNSRALPRDASLRHGLDVRTARPRLY